jgi:hypothetical protein
MDLNSQLHAPTALLWGKVSPCNTHLIKGWEVPKTGPDILKNLKFSFSSLELNYGSSTL